MSLNVGNNTSGLNANRGVWQATKQKNKAMEALSSGRRINKGSDDPSGLLISELLRSQISGSQRALRNTQETSNAMSIAEGGLSSVSSMLNNMRSLAIQAMNTGVTGQDQTYANQMSMNSLLTSVNRVTSTTNYAGQNLLDGSSGFTFDTSDSAAMIDAGGTSISNISGTTGSDISVGFAGGEAAQAEKAYVEADFGGTSTADLQEFTVTGSNGAHTFSFAAGTSVTDMATQINSMASSTGVNAYAIQDEGSGATSMRLVSSEYGSNATVKVDQISGDGFAAAGSSAMDFGQDATVSVNGQDVTTNGLVASVSGGGVNARIAFNEGDPSATTIAQTGYDQDTVTNATASQDSSLTNVKGGMQVQLGEGSSGQNRENISLGNYSSASLGTVEHNGETYSLNDLYGGGAASLANNPELALKVIDQAISDVASGRANIGAYQANALDTNASNLSAEIESLTASESAIADADMAEMMTMFIKNKLLEDSGLKSMQSAQMNSQNVLQLLSGLSAAGR